MGPDLDDRLLSTAARQHGLVGDSQARDLGFSPSRWRHRLARGEWERVTPRVVRRTGSRETPLQLAMAAVLDAGRLACLGYESGAALWGAPGYSLRPWEVVVLRDHVRSSQPTLATVHRPRFVVPPFVTRFEDVPVAVPSLLVLQMAGRAHPARLKRLFDWFLTRRLLSVASTRRDLAPLMHRGRAGVAALRELLDGLPEGYVAPASGLEARVEAIIAGAGLPAMRRQVDLGDDERWCGRVDFVATDLPLVLEVDSETYHSALSDAEADAARQARLEGAGFVVARVTDQQAWHRRHEVVAEVLRGRAEAARMAGVGSSVSNRETILSLR